MANTELEKLEAQLIIARQRFGVCFYTIKKMQQSPGAPFFVSANLISSGYADAKQLPAKGTIGVIYVPQNL